MELTKYKIGELIELTNEKNANGLYGEDDAIGVNIDKIIMPMRGNLEKKDFSNFHLVPPRHFAYNPRGSRKLGIGFNDTEKTFIITFNDNVFRIKETAKKKILDTYLFMYLCRKEWDRYAEFISWGSSTEVFDWNIFCEEEIFLPPIQIQQKYVDVYNAMLENQKSYEHGLDDLKLSFEALLDEYKHKVEKMPIGSLLKEVDNRKVLLDNKKVKEIENYYKKCVDDGATYEDIEASKKAMSSMEIILGEPSRLERLATDIHNHYVASCAGDPDRIQKAMVVCSNRKIAYALLQKFKDKYPEWFEEKKSLDGVSVTEEELKELKPMPFMAMVSSVGSNDEKDMYDYLGGVKNDKRSEELDAAFKQEKSNFSIVIVVDMWITGFDVPCLTYLYNDKPLKKHLLIQTISRVNRKYPGKEYGMVIDYIGIRDNMREAMKVYGGDTSVAPTSDDVEQATSVFREELEVLCCSTKIIG